MFILPKTTIVDFSGQYVEDHRYGNPQYKMITVNSAFINNPVNVRLVETFKKDELSINDKVGLTAYLIKFTILSRKSYIVWYFKDKDEREFEFEKILKLED